ncbi:uncharacterized protein LOC130892326 [Diorhabda carinulata]|uniref:uncharacterized protein LOC130892326 n=1 Tax=Diorhabda carinulata TaxID=1163345 RepID=UPI0025A2E53E|nr:uncharacterized protein LOC130892326 [Diorhabda carinulata]
MLCQILPTAYFVNSGFWPFYRTGNGRDVCVCSIFNLPCLHGSQFSTSINIGGFIDENQYFKFQGNQVKLVDLEVDVSLPETLTRVKICIKYRVKQLWYNGIQLQERILRTIFIDELCLGLGFPENAISRTRQGAKLTCNVVKMSNFCLWCTPHPLKCPLYYCYFRNLGLECNNNFPIRYDVEWQNCPDHTIVVDHIATRHIILTYMYSYTTESDDEDEALDLSME